jgi:DNA replication and repair protein RecF
MQLNSLKINYFKNYSEESFVFSSKVNIFTGSNGAGKTNILDAIYYLSFTKSFFNVMDSSNVNTHSDYFLVSGEYKNALDGIDNVSCAFKINDRKHFKINNKEYSRMADHVGLFPLVIISPFDSNLINGGGEERRKYIDGVISQFDKAYLELLLDYNKVLQQRNAYLKYLFENRNSDPLQLDIWDEKLVFIGNQIHQKRELFLKEFIPIVKEFYAFITRNSEPVNLEYRSQIYDIAYSDLILNNRNRDISSGYTNGGVHRDDIVLFINGLDVRKFASQGQQKSFVVALKLAQFEYTKIKKGYKPLLLLDDIFDKLDIHRIEQLMKLVSRNEFGQIFITDTNTDRVVKIFNAIEVEPTIYEIENGKISNGG